MKRLLLALILCGTLYPQYCKAQNSLFANNARNHIRLKNVDITVGVALPHALSCTTVEATEDNPPPSITHPYYLKQSIKTKSNPSWALSAFYHFNVVKVSPKNAFAIVVGIEGFADLADHLTQSMRMPRSNQLSELDMDRITFSLPVGVGYQFGAFAAQDAAVSRFSFGLGAALAPTFDALSLVRNGSNFYSPPNKVRLRPYLYADLGFFAAAQWKIRIGLYPKGNLNYHKGYDPNASYFSDGTYKTVDFESDSPLFQITVGFVPFDNRMYINQ